MTVVLITHHMREADRGRPRGGHGRRQDGIADGTPKKVFSQSGAVKRRMGLTVPETTDLLYELQRAGLESSRWMP